MNGKQYVVVAAVAGIGLILAVSLSHSAPAVAPQQTLLNHQLTPGMVMTTDTALICQKGYAGSVRNVPNSIKNQVFAEYGVTKHSGSTYEVDHLIPLELGGANDIKNLWPEPAPEFHTKDRVENAAHDAVCSGRLDLPEAQQKMAENWADLGVQLGVH